MDKQSKQNEIRDRVDALIKNKGVRAKFIAQQISLDESVLCRFRKGTKELWDSSLNALEQFLDSY
jgi:hypothetical protein